MTFDDIINGEGGVRTVLNDPQKVTWSDDTLMTFANDALQAVAHRRPDLFSTFGDVSCTAGETFQRLPATALRLMEVIRNKDGDAVTEAKKQQLDLFRPGWHNDTAAATLNWIRHETDPTAFYIYPKAPAAHTLVVQYAKIPEVYTIANPCPLAGYESLVKSYIIFMAETIEDEAAMQERAAAFFQFFDRGLGITAAAKAVTDNQTVMPNA
jgi:hypothetical protein